MATSTSPKKPRKPSGSTRPAPTPHLSTVITATTGGVALSALLGIPWLHPVLAAIPMILWLRGDHEPLAPVLLRWTLTVLVMTLVVTAFDGGRLDRAVPLAGDPARQLSSWLGGEAAAPFSVAYIVIAALAFSVAVVFSRGLVACLVWATILGQSALAAAAVFETAHNGIQAMLIALPPWQWMLLAGLYLFFVPLLRVSRAWLGPVDLPTDGTIPKRTVVVAGGLVGAALLLHPVLAGLYAGWVSAWTIH